jgi:hypothetical protein
LKLLRKKNLFIKRGKCKFLQKEELFLEVIISEKGNKLLNLKTMSIRDFPKPNSVKLMRRFLGMVNFCTKYVVIHSGLGTAICDDKRKDSLSPVDR